FQAFLSDSDTLLDKTPTDSILAPLTPGLSSESCSPSTVLAFNLPPVLHCYPSGIHPLPASSWQFQIKSKTHQTLHFQTQIVSPLAVTLSINFDEFPVPDSGKQILTNLLNLLLPPECASASQPSTLGRSRPYQGVRVRDPVKELLRRKRSLEHHSARTHSIADVVAHNNQLFTQGGFGSDVASASSAEQSVGDSDEGLQCARWKAAPSVTNTGLQPAVMPWSSSDYNQQDSAVQNLAYPNAPALTADVYMQTLCPSYTMLTYTHTPLLTNFGTIPVAAGQTSLAQMELPDSGLAYPLWAQPLTTISAMPSPGVQFAPASAALPGSPLVHMPLPMSLTTMIPQPETQEVDPHPQILDVSQHSEQELDQELQDHSLNKDPEVEPESPNLLDKLLEDHKGHGEEEDKDAYSRSLFLPNV
ncbi:POU domain class 2-associating factor 1, partial [Girardinichthys multiradiatus]|uniref:POU domain class 2-associating factor 1 n=1 Tax=Girardinichthys multiradiatus TaxID=208333 RepID=UPI001FABC540